MTLNFEEPLKFIVRVRCNENHLPHAVLFFYCA
jgi:hypothetical protein